MSELFLNKLYDLSDNLGYAKRSIMDIVQRMRSLGLMEKTCEWLAEIADMMDEGQEIAKELLELSTGSSGREAPKKWTARYVAYELSKRYKIVPEFVPRRLANQQKKYDPDKEVVGFTIIPAGLPSIDMSVEDGIEYFGRVIKEPHRFWDEVTPSGYVVLDIQKTI